MTPRLELGVFGVPLALACFASSSAGQGMAMPGDANYDWQVDLTDLAGMRACITGPGVEPEQSCLPYDLDADADVDLHDFGVFQRNYTGQMSVVVATADDGDDGTEVNGDIWFEDGPEHDRNRLGVKEASSYDVGLRFMLPTIAQGTEVVYARIAFPCREDGIVAGEVNLRIVGVDLDSAPGFGELRPSELPKTEATIDWVITEPWPSGLDDEFCSRTLRFSPDVADVVNEVLARPEWGTGSEGKSLALVVEDAGTAGTSFVAFDDHRVYDLDCPDPSSAKLELYLTTESTFIAREFLGRPTDHSVTVTAMSLIGIDAFVEYGPASGQYDRQTAVTTFDAGEPIEFVLDNLTPDARSYYRLNYSRIGEPETLKGREHSVQTQRPPGSSFVFTVQADSHVESALRDGVYGHKSQRYRWMLYNAANDKPDFHLSLGDENMLEVLDRIIEGNTIDDAFQYHQHQRPFLDLLCHSAPYFFVLGNHEGEQGWRLDGTADNLAVQAVLTRKMLYPNPVPDDFYTGNSTVEEFVDLRENYFAWTWGDALFVALDPFAYTMTQPFGNGSHDRWDWTLGQVQYDWLVETLETSRATFKFIFSHHVTGGYSAYGRGGIEGVNHELGGVGSYEWGGENLDGTWGFDEQRPGWGKSIHQLLVDTGVTIYFHGHDHVYVKQDLDGVVYQASPQPNTISECGFYADGGYASGDKASDGGHLRVTVAPSAVTVAYVRAHNPGEGTNGEVELSYVIPAGQ